MTDEHARIEELLSAMQDGAVTPEEAMLVQRHLATCVQCRATAAAFEQIDRQVRRYLMATPVPEMAAPWRNEPLVVVAPRRRGNLGHWRVTTVGLALIFALLFAATALTFFQRNGQEEVLQGADPSAGVVAIAVTPTQESSTFATGPAAASAAAGAAVPTAARAAAAAAPSIAATNVPPAAAASSAAASSAAASSAAAASARPSAAASAAASGSAPPVVALPAATPTADPSKGTATTDSSIVNPTQQYRLNSATALTICRPACDLQAQPPELLRRVVDALDRPLSPAPPVPPSTVTIPYVTLRFTLADGQVVDIGYYLQIDRLQLPDGRPLVVAPEDFVAALAGVVAPR